MSTLSVQTIRDIRSLDFSNTEFAGAYNASNAAFNQSNLAYISSNAAFNQSNLAYISSNAAFNQSNLAYISSNAAFNQSNLAYISSNAAFNQSNLAYISSNAAYASINSNWTVTNTVYGVANAAYASINSNWTVTNTIYGVANAAYAAANSKVASVTGTAGQIFSSGGNTPTLNLISSGVTATTYGGITNIPIIVVDTFGRITSASNTAISMGGDPSAAFNTANAAYASINSNWTVTNTVYGVANAAFGTTNTISSSIISNWTVTNAIYSVANAAYASVNSNWTVTNTVYGVANAAYGRANTALQNTNVTLAGNLTTTGNVYAPIFFDSSDTAYYINPNSSSRFYGLTMINRLYSNEWIQFDNHTGNYSPLNAAHFYPNNGTYGAWRIDGSRNGWQGIEFQGQATLMMNDDNYGFHRNTGGGWRFYVTGGSGHFPGNVVAYWSDRRLKENLRPIGKEATDILSKLTTYRFNWNEKVKDFNIEIQPGKEEIGLIAQEVQSILPDAVQVNKSANKIKTDGRQEESEYLTINWNKITPLLIQALNDTTRELNELKQLLKDKGIL